MTAEPTEPASEEHTEYLTVFVRTDEPWMEFSLCAQTDPEAFFPERGGTTQPAKKVCLACEVRAECLDYALTHDEPWGIWGGKSRKQREEIKRDLPDREKAARRREIV